MVYIFLADGFEEIEALTQVDYLRRAGIDITTLGIDKEFITGSKGITVKADMTIENVNADDATMIILPGGLMGVEGISTSKRAVEIIKKAYQNNTYIAAICAAPTILANLGMLKGKKCVCYPSMQTELEENGGIVCDEAVAVDGKIITARAAGASEEFAFAIIELLKGKEDAQKVRVSICAR